MNVVATAPMPTIMMPSLPLADPCESRLGCDWNRAVSSWENYILNASSQTPRQIVS
jgi:hypothetical protein